MLNKYDVQESFKFRMDIRVGNFYYCYFCCCYIDGKDNRVVQRKGSEVYSGRIDV